MFGPTQHVKIQETDGGPEQTSAACQAEKQANLDFTVKDMNGAKVRLADYKGKVILVNFWSKSDPKDNSPRTQWLRHARETFDFSAVAALLR